MNNLRTIEAHIVQKLKNNEPRPTFTGSCKKKRVDFTCSCVVMRFNQASHYVS